MIVPYGTASGARIMAPDERLIVQTYRRHTMKWETPEAIDMRFGMELQQATECFPAEAKEKLGRVRPGSLGQASRISGISPADLAVVLMYLESGREKRPVG